MSGLRTWRNVSPSNINFFILNYYYSIFIMAVPGCPRAFPIYRSSLLIKTFRNVPAKSNNSDRLFFVFFCISKFAKFAAFCCMENFRKFFVNFHVSDRILNRLVFLLLSLPKIIESDLKNIKYTKTFNTCSHRFENRINSGAALGEFFFSCFSKAIISLGLMPHPASSKYSSIS